MDLSRIPAQPETGLINVLIEIPAGSKNKYEFDKDMNAFALDRVLFASVHYPYDYGFVPKTNMIDSIMLGKGGDDCITSVDGWTTTLEEDQTMQSLAADDPTLSKILNFRVRLKESYKTEE